jgi:hypothetical protein
VPRRPTRRGRASARRASGSSDDADDHLGRASRIGEAARETTSSGQLIGAHSYRDLEAELPEDLIVDADHNGQRLGELVFGEIAPDAARNVVCVLDNDRIAELEQPVYFSPRLLMHGDVQRRSYIAERAELIGLSLTTSPATLAARPIQWRRGDIRHSPDTSAWPGSWRYHDPLLERAEQHLSGEPLLTRSRARARHLVDRRHRAEDDYGPPISSYDRLRAGDWRSLPGGLRKSAHRGRILSVR